ncbi:MAG: sterol desaturase family protein [Kiloniellaceae bacterium]
MELTDTGMTERQRDFRREYRRRIVGWYNGWLHVAVIYTIGIAGFYIYVSHIRDVSWWEWLTVPIVFLLCNVFERFVHRYVMHRPQKSRALRAIYTRHTLMHHQFFTDDEMRFADHKDWRVTFFPPYALVVFILMSIPGALVLGWLISANAGWLLICTTTGMYLVYEFMHFCCHIDESAFVRNCPFVNTIRRHHAAHHNQSIMMERNMNLTFPIADWMFGTSDLDRGLLGHVFNGYDTKYVKKDLPRASRTPHGRGATGGAAAATA